MNGETLSDAQKSLLASLHWMYPSLFFSVGYDPELKEESPIFLYVQNKWMEEQITDGLLKDGCWRGFPVEMSVTGAPRPLDS